MIYGYCRISRKSQKIERQVENILKEYPDAKIFSEAFTGTKLDGRKEFSRLLKMVTSGDTIVFDEVSRMSRNAEEGFELYTELYKKDISLVFLKEPHINTATFKQAMAQQISMKVDTGKESTDKLIGSVIDALNVFMLDLVREQIKLAFDHAQKEVDYLHKRTSEGMRAAGAPKKISRSRTGQTYETPKAKKAKAFIRKRNKGFGGDLSNEETWTLCGISKMTFYKYQKEIIASEK